MTSAPADDTTNISLSATRAYQRCPQLYTYQYIERLRKRDRAVALDLGSLIHDYLENYYRGLQEGAGASEAHEGAQYTIRKNWSGKLRSLAEAAYLAGNEELALEIRDLGKRTIDISSRYFQARGQADAERYMVLLVEQPLTTMLTDTLRSRGKVDLVTQDRETGRTQLWEHKSAKNIPDEAGKLRDLQTLLYREQLALLEDMQIDEVIWNYLRTKPPTVPKLVYVGKKNERMEFGNIDTTWEVYAQACRDNGKDPDDPMYDHMRAALANKEQEFFARWPQVIIANTSVMLSNYARTGQEIRRFTRRYLEGKTQPIRVLDTHCDWCEFNMLCRAEILGGDSDDIRRLRYESSRRDNATNPNP